MKKSLLILFALLPTFLYAGVIMKQSGERLEDVTIKSVTNTEIVYVLNGTETTLPKSEVSAILYDDGRYEEFKTATYVSTEEPAVFNDYDIKAVRYMQEAKMREAEARKLAQEQKKREAAEKKQAQEAAKLEALEKARFEAEEARLAKEREYQDGLIHKISSDQYYFIDNYYSKKNIQSLIITQCPDAQQYYNNAKKWVVGGWSGAGASCGLVIIGGILSGIGDANYWEKYWIPEYWVDWGGGYGYWEGGYYRERVNESAVTLHLAGIIMMSSGAACFITSLTIACIGHTRQDKIYEVYNSSCAQKKEPILSFNFGATRDGIGLTMHF